MRKYASGSSVSVSPLLVCGVAAPPQAASTSIIASSAATSRIQRIDFIDEPAQASVIVELDEPSTYELQRLPGGRVSLRLYGKTMSRQENLLLNAYSTLINFFGPGQSGPVFRGIYLKKRLNLGVKKYVFATLIYYGFYAVISAFFLFVGSHHILQQNCFCR